MYPLIFVNLVLVSTVYSIITFPQHGQSWQTRHYSAAPIFLPKPLNYPFKQPNFNGPRGVPPLLPLQPPPKWSHLGPPYPVRKPQYPPPHWPNLPLPNPPPMWPPFRPIHPLIPQHPTPHWPHPRYPLPKRPRNIPSYPVFISQHPPPFWPKGRPPLPFPNCPNPKIPYPWTPHTPIYLPPPPPPPFRPYPGSLPPPPPPFRPYPGSPPPPPAKPSYTTSTTTQRSLISTQTSSATSTTNQPPPTPTQTTSTTTTTTQPPPTTPQEPPTSYQPLPTSPQPSSTTSTTTQPPPLTTELLPASTQPPSTTTQPPPTTPQQPLDPFDELFCDLCELDEMIKPFAHNTTRMEIGPESSSIHVSLLDCEEDSIEVKLKHRVLSITATPKNGTKYEELVIVPSIFDSRNVNWVYDGKELVVNFDKIEDYEEVPTCVKNISTTVKIVPNYEDVFDFEENVVL